MKNTKEKSGILYVVATPIGNLEDITYRAVKILSQVEYIASEDTRVTGKLLKLLNLKNKQKFISYFEGNETKRSSEICDLIETGKSIAVVSDAGTPAISDPGRRVVSEAIDRGIKIVPIPGVSAATTLYSVAGLNSNSFHFEGFLPVKKQHRHERLMYIKSLKEPCIIYEAPHRIIKTLKDLLNYYEPNSKIVIARELTKLHEEIFQKTIKETLEYFENTKPIGEFSLIINISEDYKQEFFFNINALLIEQIKKLANMNLSPKTISSILVIFHKIPKREIYNLSLEYINKNQKSPDKTQKK